jgi:hypothetical protein
MSDDLLTIPWADLVPAKTQRPLRPQPKQHTPAFRAVIAMPYNILPAESRQTVVAACDAVDVPSGVSRQTQFGTLHALVSAFTDPGCVVLHVHAHADAAGQLFLEDKCGAAFPLRPSAQLRLLNMMKWREVCAEGEDVPLQLQLAVFAGIGTEASFAAGASRVPHIVAHRVDVVRVCAPLAASARSVDLVVGFSQEYDHAASASFLQEFYRRVFAGQAVAEVRCAGAYTRPRVCLRNPLYFAGVF